MLWWLRISACSPVSRKDGGGAADLVPGRLGVRPVTRRSESRVGPARITGNGLVEGPGSGLVGGVPPDPDEVEFVPKVMVGWPVSSRPNTICSSRS